VRGVRDFRFAMEASRWPSVLAIVSASEVERDSDSEGVSYRPCVSYSYEIEGRSYQGSTLFPGFENAYAFARSAKGIAEKYAVGSKVYVAVDPRNPARSILDPNRRRHIHVHLASCSLLVMIGLMLLVWYLRR
jgi:hypothetical protein